MAVVLTSILVQVLSLLVPARSPPFGLPYLRTFLSFLIVVLVLVLVASPVTVAVRISMAPAKAGEDAGADKPQPRGLCTTCISVVERLKLGLTDDQTRDSVCEELWFNSLSKDDYKACFDVLSALHVWEGHFEQWLEKGCYRKESYGFVRGGHDMILINPCPSHVICGVLTNPDTPTDESTKTLVSIASESMSQPFCRKTRDEYNNDFFLDDKRVRD